MNTLKLVLPPENNYHFRIETVQSNGNIDYKHDAEKILVFLSSGIQADTFTELRNILGCKWSCDDNRYTKEITDKIRKPYKPMQNLKIHRMFETHRELEYVESPEFKYCNVANAENLMIWFFTSIPGGTLDELVNLLHFDRVNFIQKAEIIKDLRQRRY